MYGSTNLVNELGDIKFREISRTHEGVLGDAIRDHEGYIVKELGDGFMAAFASSRNAVICAMEIQKSLKILRAKQPELPINVRIGLNTVTHYVLDFLLLLSSFLLWLNTNGLVKHSLKINSFVG